MVENKQSSQEKCVQKQSLEWVKPFTEVRQSVEMLTAGELIL
jgi:hypothetical protein